MSGGVRVVERVRKWTAIGVAALWVRGVRVGEERVSGS